MMTTRPAAANLSKLTFRVWQQFIQDRRLGAIDATGVPVEGDRRKAVRTGTVAADLVFLLSVLNWAAKWRTDDGHYLMRENLTRGFRLPEDLNPRRPVMTEDRLQKLRAVAPRVTMLVGPKTKPQITPSYLLELLDLANGTGRRISAILALRYDDLRLNEGPCGSIRWRAEADKVKREWLVPIAADVRAAITRVLAQRPGIGSAYLFPSGQNPSKPVTKDVAAEWLGRAEELAELATQEGTAWHALRRKWVNERKGLPLADVAAAGGWIDKNTVLNIYMQADQETMYRVVSEPAKLRESGGQG